MRKANKSTDITEVLEKYKDRYESEEIYGFSDYLIGKFSDAEYDREKGQKSAWSNFRKAIQKAEKKNISGKCMDISVKTMRKWFGIGGKAIPKREQIFRLAYQLTLSAEETEEYLKKGLGTVGFQYNDYREWIYLYGLQRCLPFYEAEKMILDFEEYMKDDQIFQQNTHTSWLRERYEENAGLEPEEFLQWMNENASFFKGYSKTALHYLEKYLDEVDEILRNEEKKELNWLLEEIDYKEYRESWLQKYPEETEEDGDRFELAMIRRYIRYASRKRERLSEELCNDILHTAKLAYGGENRHNIIANLYPVQWNGEKKGVPFRKLTDTRLSMLLRIADRKEKEIRQLWSDGSSGGSEQSRERSLWSSFYVEREDLLPLIHYVSEVRYYETAGEKGYSQADAIRYFKDRADSVLQACGMEPVSEEFALDYLLLSCFGREEMYQISDVIEYL